MSMKLKLNIDIWTIPRDREVFLQEDYPWSIVKSRDRGTITDIPSSYSTRNISTSQNARASVASWIFRRTEGERIASRKSVQRDTGKISTLNEFPGFFQSFSFACPPAWEKWKRIRSMKSITGSWARWMARDVRMFHARAYFNSPFARGTREGNRTRWREHSRITFIVPCKSSPF